MRAERISGAGVSFEYLDHTADTAVRLRSCDGAELFGDATRALVSILLDTAASVPVEPRAAIPIRLEAEGPEALLVDYLNELIFLFDTRGFLASGIEVSRVELGAPSILEGMVRGESHDPSRHAVKTEVKATTFHGLDIRRTEDGLEADVVFDL